MNPPVRLLIATTNPGKIREVEGALRSLPGLDLISLRDLPPIPEPPETGRSFLENAVAKAVAYSRLAEGIVPASPPARQGEPHGPPDRSQAATPGRAAPPDEPRGPIHLVFTLADDSGLCVEALGGEPGVRSARYGGAGLDDPGRCRLLLEKIRDVPEGRRGARFECVLALASGGALVETFAGVVEGRLLFEERGEGGFGYDPIFFYPPAGRTFAEMTREEKSAVSHRGRALAALRRYLEEHVELSR